MQTWVGLTKPTFAATTRIFIWLTFSLNGRRASSYRFVTTRFSIRRRTAMHVLAIRSTVVGGFFIIGRATSLTAMIVYANIGVGKPASSGKLFEIKKPLPN